MAMNGLSKMAVAAATALLLVLTIVPGAVAVTYTIEWTTGVDYSGWATGKTFRVGDILEFKYGSSHTVDVVDKAGYDGCDASSSTENHSDGDTKIDLKTVGINYFICSTPGHCSGGMKLAVNVVAGSADLRPLPRHLLQLRELLPHRNHLRLADHPHPPHPHLVQVQLLLLLHQRQVVRLRE
nr:uclacyanin II [Arabidopsis thaliana]